MDMIFQHGHEEYLEDYFPNAGENEKYKVVCEHNDEYLADARMNLDITLEAPILAIADMGLWYGRRTGYVVISSGNIRDILSTQYDYVKWYSDGRDVKAVMHHHDGTNFVKYRCIRNNRSEAGLERMLSKIYNQQYVSQSELNYYTRSIHPDVANVYGWPVRQRTAPEKIAMAR